MRKIFLIGPVVGLALAGCNAHTPIVAVATDDIGIVAGITPQSQGAALTVGYKGAKFAVLPVESGRGNLLGIQTGNGKEIESYSIFAQLGLNAKGGASRGVGVEQVLAIGPAADAWVKNATPVPKPVPAAGGQ